MSAADHPDPRSSLIDDALALAEQGLPVFPVKSDKKPLWRSHAFKDATRDPALIRKMFAKRRAALIAIPTGRDTRRVVIDIDPRHDGPVWFAANKEKIPPTRTHGTQSGGEHLVFRDPPEVMIRNSEGRIAPGVDVRGTGGYVIVPPSKGYTIKHDGELADMPPWLIDVCLPPPRPPPPPRSPRQPPLDGDGTPYGLKALDDECDAIRCAPFGQQETTFNNAALKIGGLVAGAELNESYALAELIAAGNAMPSESNREPWLHSEIVRKARRGLTDGMRTPRSGPPRPPTKARAKAKPKAKPKPSTEPPPENETNAQRDHATEPPPAGNKTHSHIWRSKEGDVPCTPTGKEGRSNIDGRIYALVTTDDGSESIVPKEELVLAQAGNGSAAGEDGKPPLGGEDQPPDAPDKPVSETRLIADIITGTGANLKDNLRRLAAIYARLRMGYRKIYTKLSENMELAAARNTDFPLWSQAFDELPDIIKSEIKKFRDECEAKAAEATDEVESRPDEDDEKGQTEQKFGRKFAAEHANQLRFNHTSGRWMIWSGHLWKLDETATAERLSLDFIMKELGENEDIFLEKAHFARAVREIARTMPPLATSQEQWDNDPWLLGTPNGVVELKTGLLRDGRREDLISKSTLVAPSNTIECPQFEKFLLFALNEDEPDDPHERFQFIKRYFGYCLTGVTREEVLLYISGAEGTGKGTTIKTIQTILGDYAISLPAKIFTDQGWRSLEYYRAQLQGVRFAVASEPEDNAAWSEGLINELTGGDHISARHPYGRPFTFNPTHKLTMNGNSVPSLKSSASGLKRRLALVMFDRKPENPDKDLKIKLLEEAPQILRLMIDACVAWNKEGLAIPESAKEAANEYFDRADPFKAWMEDCCLPVVPTYRTKPGEVLASYNAWAVKNAERPMNKNMLHEAIRRLKDKSYVPARTVGCDGSMGSASNQPSSLSKALMKNNILNTAVSQGRRGTTPTQVGSRVRARAYVRLFGFWMSLVVPDVPPMVRTYQNVPQIVRSYQGGHPIPPTSSRKCRK
jgi:putative DNA primase/helicase